MCTVENSLICMFIGSFSLGVFLIGSVVFLLFKFYVPPFLVEKGKNLATRQDIEEITNKIEGVRIQYTFLAEELKARHQFRLAALEKRLEVHQQAFTLWRKLLAFLYKDEIVDVVMECQTWWNANCIYLEAPVRSSFIQAYCAVGNHKSLLNGSADSQDIKDSYKIITDFSKVLFESVQLPALSALEAENIGMDIN